ncbi:MAG: hypothetical protein AAF938_09425 [Myxococcota bacterium]
MLGLWSGAERNLCLAILEMGQRPIGKNFNVYAWVKLLIPA